MGLRVNPSLKKYVDDLVAAEVATLEASIAAAEAAAIATSNAYTDVEAAAAEAAAIATSNAYTDAEIAAAIVTANAYTDAEVAAHVPVGLMLIWNTDTAPGGWLLCYGQAVSRATYNDLFAIIGTTFGVGDGSTTFNLPDLRGRLPLGQDDMGGVSANRVTNVEADSIGGNAGDEDIPAHTHSLPYFEWADTKGGEDIGLFTEDSTKITTDSTGTGVNNMPPYLTTNYIIKY